MFTLLMALISCVKHLVEKLGDSFKMLLLPITFNHHQFSVSNIYVAGDLDI